MEIKYTGEQFKKLLTEGIAGYNPIVAQGVTSTNKSTNTSATKEMIKNSESLTKSLKKDDETVKFNDVETGYNNNKNLLDLKYDSDPGKDFKDRIKKAVVGDPTMGNFSDDGSADLEGNKEIYKDEEEKAKELSDKDNILKNTGLVSKFIDTPKKHTAFEGIDLKNTNRIVFKSKTFLGEQHMFSLIPEHYKLNGKNFIMKDAAGDEYLIEWVVDGKINKGNIKIHLNKEKINEDFNKIKNLYGFKLGQTNTIKKDVITEDNIIRNMVSKIKNITDQI